MRLVDELPGVPKGRTPDDCWAFAEANPGKWVETDLSSKGANTLRRRWEPRGFKVVVRRDVTYVRFVGQP